MQATKKNRPKMPALRVKEDEIREIDQLAKTPQAVEFVKLLAPYFDTTSIVLILRFAKIAGYLK
jgi:hypothetical protein